MDKKIKSILVTGCLVGLVVLIVKCCKVILETVYAMETLVLTRHVYNRYHVDKGDRVDE